MRRTALGTAERADINAQLSQRAQERVSVHSQHLRGFALIPIDLSKNRKKKLFFEFFQRFGIENTRPMHPQYQSFKLRLRGIRMFRTHVRPGRHRRGDMYESLAAEGERRKCSLLTSYPCLEAGSIA